MIFNFKHGDSYIYLPFQLKFSNCIWYICFLMRKEPTYLALIMYELSCMSFTSHINY
jgi:hypothetical protein